MTMRWPPDPSIRNISYLLENMTQEENKQGFAILMFKHLIGQI